MKKTLEMLWDMYSAEYPQKSSEELDDLMKKVYDSEELLCGMISNEHQEILIRCHNRWDKVVAVSEKQAFVRGVEFATKYLLESLNR